MELIALLKYLSTVVLTGEASNIWLATLPESLVNSAYEIGLYIAGLLF